MERRNLKKLIWEKNLWTKGYHYVAGVDEAGRGPLAGPVISAAVIFRKTVTPFELDDSKRLSPTRREHLYELIFDRALTIGIGCVDEKLIDEINILQSTFSAMRKAVASLQMPPDFIMVDGRWEIPDLNISQTSIVKGDQKCFSIAAASIIAKVTRDKLMTELDRQYPQYNFATHKGYETKKHIDKINKYGFCPIHRKSFKIKNMEQKWKSNQ